MRDGREVCRVLTEELPHFLTLVKLDVVAYRERVYQCIMDAAIDEEDDEDNYYLRTQDVDPRMTRRLEHIFCH